MDLERPGDNRGAPLARLQAVSNVSNSRWSTTLPFAENNLEFQVEGGTGGRIRIAEGDSPKYFCVAGEAARPAQVF